MAGFDVNAAKAAGWSDQEIAAYLAQTGHTALRTPAQVQAAKPLTASGYDPSAGGGSFSVYVPGVGTVDTGMHTPEWLDRTLAGAGRGMVHTINSVRDLVGDTGRPQMTTSDLITGNKPTSRLEDEARLDAPLMATTAGKVGNIVGEGAITAPIGAGAVGAVGRLGAMGAKAAAQPLVNALIQGGTQGLVTADPGSRLENATIGAVTSGALGAAGQGVKKLAQGLTQTPAAQYLRSVGVNNLTPGQLNPGGVANQFEQAIEHVPVVGQLVQGARENAEHQYQRAVFQAAAAPGAAPIKASSNIHDMLQQAYDSYEPLYSPAKGHPVDPGDVGALRTGLSSVGAQPGTSVAGQQAGQSFVDNELTRLPQNPTSTDLLTMRSNLRQAARKAKLATDSVAQDKATVYDAAEQQVTDALRLNLPQHAQQALDAADSNYGNYKIVENAVAQSKDNIAGLTPQKLSQAVYNATADPAYARGAGGPLRDLAKAGTETFQGVVPYNGAVMAPLLAGGLAAHAAPVPAIIGGTGALGLSLTDTGRSLAAGATPPQQAAQRLTQALLGYVPDNLQAPLGAIAGRTATAAAAPYTPQVLPQATAAVLGLLPTAGAAAQH